MLKMEPITFVFILDVHFGRKQLGELWLFTISEAAREQIFSFILLIRG